MQNWLHSHRYVPQDTSLLPLLYFACPQEPLNIVRKGRGVTEVVLCNTAVFIEERQQEMVSIVPWTAQALFSLNVFHKRLISVGVDQCILLCVTPYVSTSSLYPHGINVVWISTFAQLPP